MILLHWENMGQNELRGKCEKRNWEGFWTRLTYQTNQCTLHKDQCCFFVGHYFENRRGEIGSRERERERESIAFFGPKLCNRIFFIILLFLLVCTQQHITKAFSTIYIGWNTSCFLYIAYSTRWYTWNEWIKGQSRTFGKMSWVCIIVRMVCFG